MTIDEYQRLAARTINDHVDNIANGALGLCGEAGEVADIVKKCWYQGHDLEDNRERIIEEIGDCAWYLACLCTAMCESLDNALTRNIAKLRWRYPEGFDAERSLHRDEIPFSELPGDSE